MRQIRLILDTDSGSIGYLVDLEKEQYQCGAFDKVGVLSDTTDSGEILDSTMLAKRLYLVIEAAMREQVPTVVNKLPEPKVEVEV